MREQRFSVVVCTAGRPGLTHLLDTLADSLALADRAALDLHEIIVVDDRPGSADDWLSLPEPGPLKTHIRTVRTGGRGPAAARNAGWRSTSVPWVVFLDDDTELSGPWADDLVADLESTGPAIGFLTARAGDRVTDVAVRRELLDQNHGFDERRGTGVEELIDRAASDWTLATAHRVSTANPANPKTPNTQNTQNTRNTPAPTGRPKPDLTRPLLLGAAAAAAIGLLPGRFRRPALIIAAGLGLAAAVLPPSPIKEVKAETPWPPKPRAVLLDAALTEDEEFKEATDTARRAGLAVGFVSRPELALILAAADDLGVEPYECGYIGIRSDESEIAPAAHAAGARPILIRPTDPTDPAEAGSPGETDDGSVEIADDLIAAVARLTGA